MAPGRVLDEVRGFDFDGLPVVDAGHERVEAIKALDRSIRAGQARLIHSPWWVLSLVLGSMFGTAMTLYSVVAESGGVASSAVGGLVSGVIFGAVMGPVTARQAHRQRSAIGDIAPHQISALLRASWRGPVPVDPELRAAALRAATHQLDATLRQRTFGTVLFAALTVASIVFVADSPWWLLATGIFLALLAGQWLTPRTIRHRIKLLTPSGDEIVHRDDS